MNNLLTKTSFTACLALKITCGVTAIHLACQPILTEQQTSILERTLIVYGLTDTIMPNLPTRHETKDNEQD